MTIEELIKATNILENNKKTIVCNSNTAKVLEANQQINKYCKIVVSEFVNDNQCLLYDKPSVQE